MVVDFSQITGVYKPHALVPKKGIDLSKWAVLACDQHTSQYDDYWLRVAKFIGKNPSTFNLVYPEYYLEESEGEKSQRVKTIQETMKKYLADGTLINVSDKPRFIYIERKLPDSRVRKGLMVALDLEHYDYEPGSQSLIRPTEGTIKERLPVRASIRRGAPLEFPHIMMLIDDPQKTVIEPLEKSSQNIVPFLDFELMLGGGHYRAFQVDQPNLENQIYQSLTKLADPTAFRQKYGVDGSQKIFLIAAGDGNHSLATAKLVWEEIKGQLENKGVSWQNHPARFAMVELVNLHDQALDFEPIHRIIYGLDSIEGFIETMKLFYTDRGCEFNLQEASSLKEIESRLSGKNHPSWQYFGMSYKKGMIASYLVVEVSGSLHTLPVGTFQKFLDEFLTNNSDIKIDFLHGEQEVLRDSLKEGNLGFYLPAMAKSDLFKTVIKNGVTPRKTFSMGTAETKSYYVMGRKIL